MKKLKISKEISLPIDAVTQTFAAIGRKGAGKTYLSTMIAEQMLDAGAQVVVIDPVGVWWGLRVGADGKSKGKDIFVIGGEHGDIPLIPEAGQKIARLLVEKGVSAVVDVSGFRLGEYKRFAADFGEEFFHLKKTHRTPVHVFVEEAQKIIPQRVGPDEARMVGAFEQIVRLGRNYGIGCTLVTQRPQSVNKEVLSQVECLCVLQLTGTHERKAVEDWVQENGVDRKLIGELPGLGRGEGYVWSPSWLRIYERVHFATKDTFDASATPEVGKKTLKAATLSKVDVEKLRSDMKEVVDQAEKDDPVALRRIIKTLETNLKLQSNSPAFDEKKAQKMVNEAVAKVNKEWGGLLGKWIKYAKTMRGRIIALGQGLDEYDGMAQTILSLEPATRIIPPATKITHPEPPLKRSIRPVQESSLKDDEGAVSGPEQRILNALAWLDSIGNAEPEQTSVAFLAGYTVGGGAFNNPRGSLRSKGLIEYRGSKLALTDLGRELAQAPDEALTTEALHEKVMSILATPEQRVLKPLLESYPNELSNDELAERSGYTVGAGAFNNPKGRLRSLGLIEYSRPGFVRASDLLFLE